MNSVESDVGDPRSVSEAGVPCAHYYPQAFPLSHYLAPVAPALPAFFFKISPVYRIPFCL
jgi:hypothetical protein